MAERPSQKVYLFNCDGTYNLDIVEKFLLEVDEKHGLDISTEKLNFCLNSMGELCENTIPRLQIDIATFVVHAHESRLSINEENAGIGYAKIYKALQEATGDKVFIVIGGDDQYRDQDEEERTVISRWARRKVASQFNEEYLDGRKSFIFSWNKQHREIHEEALLHYFDPSKKGKKFEHQPKPKPVPLPMRDKRDVTSQAAGDTQQEFMVEDDGKPLVLNDEEERDISDREGKTQELRSEQAEARYGTITDYYPAGTVLLETIMRYGEISYQESDVVKRVDEWQPPDEKKARLREEYGSTPMAKVTFVLNVNGEIECAPKEISRWRRCVICVVTCAVACWAGFARCMRETWCRCGCRC